MIVSACCLSVPVFLPHVKLESFLRNLSSFLVSRIKKRCSLRSWSSNFASVYSGRKYQWFEEMNFRVLFLDYRAMATMRSKYVPEEGLFHKNSLNNISNTHSLIISARATVMNYIRIPLNLIVVVILLKVKRCSSTFTLIFIHLGFSSEDHLHELCLLFDSCCC